MTLLLFVLIIGTIFGLSISEKIPVANLLKDYFAEKYIYQVTVFTCWNSFGSVELYRELMNSGLKTGFVSIPNDNLDMHRILTVNYYKLGVVLDLDCPKSNQVFEQFVGQNIPFNESYFWLLVTKKPAPKPLLAKLPLTIATEMVIAVEDAAENIFELLDVYNPSYRHGGALNVTYIGQWGPEQGLTLRFNQYKYKRRGNLHGLSLNASIVLTHNPTPDFMTYISNPINRHVDTMHRFNYALVCQLRDYYNFKMNLLNATSWGYLINGTFDGMLGDMIAGRVDLGATPLQFKEERIDVAEYTVQTFVARPVIIFRHPKQASLRNGFLRPFSQEIWIMTLLMTVMCWFLLWTTVQFELLLNQRAPETTLETQPFSESALIVLSALYQQGLTEGPRIYSGRIVFISVFIWGLLLYQFYSASIVGSLLAEPPRYINNLKALLDSDLQLGIEDIAYNYDYFATTNDPVGIELHKRKVLPFVNRPGKRSAYLEPREGLRRVQKGGFAFQVDSGTAYKIITDTFTEDQICDLTEVELFPPKHTATVTSKHSPFKKMVTYGMRQIMERGMGDRLRQVWNYRKPKCPDSHSSIPTPVSLKDFSPALFLLSFGLLIAVAVLYVEKYGVRRTCKIYNRRIAVFRSS